VFLDDVREGSGNADHTGSDFETGTEAPAPFFSFDAGAARRAGLMFNLPA
jgi:hypothetical protein